MVDFTPWVSPDNPLYPPPDGVDQDIWSEALRQASWVLWALTAGRVHASECWEEVYSIRGSCEIVLLNGPLQDIHSIQLVKNCGATLEDLTDYCINTSWSVNLCCNNTNAAQPYWYCGCGDTAVKIEYETQAVLPPGAEFNVVWLATEYTKMLAGKACALPERVTNISRQGVSWSLLDPQDFLDKRLTGTRIDGWLATARAVYPSARLIDPLKSCRLFSRQCPVVNPLATIPGSR